MLGKYHVFLFRASILSSIYCRPPYKTAMAGRTTLMIAHCVAAGKEADTTIVLDDGSVIQRGGSETLLQPGGVYAHLVAINEVNAPSAMTPWARRAAMPNKT